MGGGTRGPPLPPPFSATAADGGDDSGAPAGDVEGACLVVALAAAKAHVRAGAWRLAMAGDRKSVV